MILLLPLAPNIFRYWTTPDRAMSEKIITAVDTAKNRQHLLGNTTKAILFQLPNVYQGKLFLANVLAYLEPNLWFFTWKYQPTHFSLKTGLFHPFESILLFFGAILLWKEDRKSMKLILATILLFLTTEAMLVSAPDPIRLAPLSFLFFYLALHALWFVYKRYSAVLTTLVLWCCYLFAIGKFFHATALRDSYLKPAYLSEYQQAFQLVEQPAFQNTPVYVTDLTYGKDLPLIWMKQTQTREQRRIWLDSKQQKQFGRFTFAREPYISTTSANLTIIPRHAVPRGIVPVAEIGTNPDYRLAILSVQLEEK